jgi:hypothetical protein
MKSCSVHTRFFDEHCVECKSQYREMKGNVNDSNSDKENDRDNKTTVHSNIEKYKEFTEERAKKLYGELLIQYLKKNCNEIEASERAKKIIRKQCSMRGMSSWDWI